MSRLLRLLEKNRESTVEVEMGVVEVSILDKLVKTDEGENNNILILQKNPDMPDASNKTTPLKSDGDHKNPNGSIAALLCISIDDVLARWRKQGSPAFPLSHGETCCDLEILLKSSKPHDWQIEAVKVWLEEHPC